MLKTAPKPANLYEPRWSVWASSFGGYSNLAGDPWGAGTHNLSSNLFGVASGFDYRPTPGVLLGFALSGGGSGFGLAQGLGGGRGDFLQAGVYGSTRLNQAYVSGAFAFSNHWLTLSRSAPIGDALSVGYSAQDYAGRIEAGFRLTSALAGLSPYVAGQRPRGLCVRLGERSDARGRLRAAAGRKLHGRRREAWPQRGARLARTGAAYWPRRALRQIRRRIRRPRPDLIRPRGAALRMVSPSRRVVLPAPASCVARAGASLRNLKLASSGSNFGLASGGPLSA